MQHMSFRPDQGFLHQGIGAIKTSSSPSSCLRDAGLEKLNIVYVQPLPANCAVLPGGRRQQLSPDRSPSASWPENARREESVSWVRPWAWPFPAERSTTATFRNIRPSLRGTGNRRLREELASTAGHTLGIDFDRKRLRRTREIIPHERKIVDSASMPCVTTGVAGM
jgi:arginine decarboxylase